MQINGWRIYYYKAFAAALDELEAEVTKLAKKDPRGYKAHPKTRLLASVYEVIAQRVPANPEDAQFRLGKTLGPANQHWRRVKKGMPDRHRLFFRFASRPTRLIVHAWLNDEDTQRKAGSKTDVYAAFQRMLARGKVPGDIDALLKESREG